MLTYLHSYILNTFINSKLLSKKRILISLSGGKDSLCLLKLIKDIQLLYQLHLGIVHCDHQWRWDSLDNSYLIYNIAKELKITFYLVINYELKDTEATVREWRYLSLLNIAIAHNYHIILTAHTSTDKIETFLYNLFRGSSLSKVSGLSILKKITNNLFIYRPLLNVTQNDTTWLCRHFYLPVWSDLTNFTNKAKRNRIRSELLPYLRQFFNPNVDKKINLFLDTLNWQNTYLKQYYYLIYSKLVHPVYIGIHIPKYNTLHSFLKDIILRIFLEQVRLESLTLSQIKSVQLFINQYQTTQVILKCRDIKFVPLKQYIYIFNF